MSASVVIETETDDYFHTNLVNSPVLNCRFSVACFGKLDFNGLLGQHLFSSWLVRHRTL